MGATTAAETTAGATMIDGDVIVVTGASRGLGRAMAERFAREGARVVPMSRSADQLEALAADAPTEMHPVAADIREADDVRRVVDEAVDHFGRIDTVVNNAAVGLLSLTGELKSVEDVTPEEWDTVIETNLRGPFLLTKYALPHMRQRGRGNLINVTSGYGKHGQAEWAPYVSSKHGLEGLTDTVARECADTGINVNAIDPGGSVETGFWNTADKRSHLPPAERDRVASPDVMNDAMVLLAGQGPEGVSGESLTTSEWEERLG